MKIEYGLDNNKINITAIFNNLLKKNKNIIFEADDVSRHILLNIDPCPCKVKNIYINDKKYDDFYRIEVDRNKNIKITEPYKEILNKYHSELIFHEDIHLEYEEQLLSVKYISPNSHVLEFGSNVGRNTCIISKILNNSNNLTTIETIPEYVQILEKNKINNNFNFTIFNGALSKYPMIQSGWNCMLKPENGIIPDGFVEIKTFNYSKIKKNYDTLVIDCEGAFYYICKDFPEILLGINTVIMENDYGCIEHKNYVDDLLYKNNLKSIYTKAGGQGLFENKFFEVFRRL